MTDSWKQYFMPKVVPPPPQPPISEYDDIRLQIERVLSEVHLTKHQVESCLNTMYGMINGQKIWVVAESSHQCHDFEMMLSSIVRTRVKVQFVSHPDQLMGLRDATVIMLGNWRSKGSNHHIDHVLGMRRELDVWNIDNWRYVG